eukprot:scpid61253/ scgid30482/ Arylsulfatase A; Cerebroside-sulfatase
MFLKRFVVAFLAIAVGLSVAAGHVHYEKHDGTRASADQLQFDHGQGEGGGADTSRATPLRKAHDLSAELPEKPNIIILFGDDMGYGDLNVYGHPTTSTPNLDQMAKEGMRFTQFYVAAPLCSPSRASILTGRLFPRSGVYEEPKKNDDTGSATFGSYGSAGMMLNETTLAQALKPLGYVSGMVGKWHLGSVEAYHPTKRGFDSYFGCPFNLVSCNSTILNLTSKDPNCMVFRNDTIIEQPSDLLNIDARFVAETKTFIDNNKNRPFFFYFASYHTHMPQFASKDFINTTERGLFGDALAQFDGDVGEILSYLKQVGIANRTLVVFTGDNGPALGHDVLGGEQGPLKCGKGTTWEGGMREPAIMWWPGVITPNTLSYELVNSMDIFPTALKLAGGQLPSDRVLDGFDLSDFIAGRSQQSPRDHVFYYSGKFLMAARLNQYKAHFYTMGSHCHNDYPDVDCRGSTRLQAHNPPLLFDLYSDPKERYPLDTETYASVATAIHDLVLEHNKTMTFAPPQIGINNSHDNYPCCNPSCTPRPTCCHC